MADLKNDLSELGWTKAKPTTPGAYWIRGNLLQADALIQVKLDEGTLMCNLHMVTTEPDFEWGYTIEQLSDDFEWLGPLVVPAQTEQQSSATQQILDLILDECRYWHGRDEARRGGFAILYGAAKEVADRVRIEEPSHV